MKVHGTRNTSEELIHLSCDSAASYANLSPVRAGLAVIGLNCPYYRQPDEMDCTFDDLMTSHLGELRRRQTYGPYHLGGWSSGGILAYRAAQMLIQENEEVHSLLLIDAPVPQGLDALPHQGYEQCLAADVFDAAGMLRRDTNASAASARLIRHFRADIVMLHDYFADALPVGHTPRVSILWAADCVLDGANSPHFQNHSEDPEGIQFLTVKRTDFSAGGWAPLFPDTVVVKVLYGAHHFSMMHKENGQKVAGFISHAIV